MNTEAAILELANEAGFDLAGIAPLAPPPDAQRFESWLDDGLAADMSWLEQNRGRIADPRGLARGRASLLVVAMAHSRPAFELPSGGRIARYAVGRDYHNRIRKNLGRLSKSLQREGLLTPDHVGRALTDAAPLLERSHAAVAGIGFPSKAANLLNPAFGPWFSIGELVLEGDFKTDGDPPNGSCGTCTACLDACPTDAILEAGRVDAGRCISYQTIENRGAVPHELREKLSGWAFGCDICSEVCPWGQKAPDLGSDWGQHHRLDQDLSSWLTQDAQSFKEVWQASAVQRPRREGLARNAALVLGLQPTADSRKLLSRLLASDPSPIVREAAAWALARAHGPDAKVADELEAALLREPDPGWQRLLKHDLALLNGDVS